MPEQDSTTTAATTPNVAAVRIIKPAAGIPLPLIDGEGTAVAIVWPGMGAQFRTMHRLTRGPWSRTVPQQHGGEAVYAVLEGDAAIVDLADGEPHSLTVGSMIHLDPNTRYSFHAGEHGAVILGGPCPPDAGLYPV